MKYLFATNNPGKVRELKAMFCEAGLSLIALSDLNLTLDAPEETGASFEENAIIKAGQTADFLRANGHCGYAVLADDSGLAIDALDGQPGVDSALFMGVDTPYKIRNAHIIKMLDDVPPLQRTARFISAIVCVLPSGETLTSRGEILGEIATAPRGEGGFGYDPIFFVPEYGKTMAELSQDEKNKISHRGKALRDMLGKLQ